MKKTPDDVVMADVYHTIKSPIVSIKSLLFVLARNKEVQANTVLQEKISLLEEKINILHQRSEIFLNYIFYKEEKVEFLYSFFNLNETVQEVVKKLNSQEDAVKFAFTNVTPLTIMADADQIKEAFHIIFTRIQTLSEPSTITISVISSGKNITITFSYTKGDGDLEKKPINSDEECVAREEYYIARKIIEMHGGSMNPTEKDREINMTIILPVKAKPSSIKK